MATYNPMSALSVTARASADALGLGVDVNHQGSAGSLSLEGFERDIGFDDVLLYVVHSTHPSALSSALSSALCLSLYSLSLYSLSL